MNVTTEKNEAGEEILVVQPNTRLLSKEEMEELSALSQEVFGASSRWATIMKKGLVEAVTEEVTEYVPAEVDAEGKETKPEETRQVVVPVYYRSPKRGETKIPILSKRMFTAEDIKVYMLELREKQRKIREMLEKMQADRAAAEKQAQLEKDVATLAAGSVK